MAHLPYPFLFHTLVPLGPASLRGGDPSLGQPHPKAHENIGLKQGLFSSLSLGFPFGQWGSWLFPDRTVRKVKKIRSGLFKRLAASGRTEGLIKHSSVHSGHLCVSTTGALGLLACRVGDMLYSMLSRRQSGVEVTVISVETFREPRISLDTPCRCIIKDSVCEKGGDVPPEPSSTF